MPVRRRVCTSGMVRSALGRSVPVHVGIRGCRYPCVHCGAALPNKQLVFFSLARIFENFKSACLGSKERASRSRPSIGWLLLGWRAGDVGLKLPAAHTPDGQIRERCTADSHRRTHALYCVPRSTLFSLQQGMCGYGEATKIRALPAAGDRIARATTAAAARWL